jgi:hypothetical protein
VALAACLGKGRNACRIEAGHALLMALLSAAAHSDWLLAAACPVRCQPVASGGQCCGRNRTLRLPRPMRRLPGRIPA